jgi:hypothetical protein
MFKRIREVSFLSTRNDSPDSKEHIGENVVVKKGGVIDG